MSTHCNFSDTDLCVKCGLCLPHCPTYNKTQDENESPRGRIALIQAWAAGQLPETERLHGHIAGCLLCRACESACPANVPYAELINRFRAETAANEQKSLLSKLRMSALQRFVQGSSAQRQLGSRLGSLLNKAGGTRAAGFAAVMDGLPAPEHSVDWVGFHPALGEERCRVDLFTGCMAEMADAATVKAAIRVLNTLGVGVRVSAQQSCCGALARHSGNIATALRLEQDNRSAFKQHEPDKVITLASGCGSALMSTLDGGKVQDISQFLDSLAWPAHVQLALWDSQDKVFLHTPCTLKNTQKAGAYPLKLLMRIPGMQLQTVADRYCCGAAGSYMLEQPEMAAALRDDVLDSISPGSAAGLLLTSNVGCAIHLRAGLKARNVANIKVMHPVQFIASRLIS
ncbi:(Fe-S)-binding protein [Candidatus Methylospira mobilis]|uniref:Glycolate oxidase iron-sulfur subunit n=1 Tax=Candidatus Methylospira mobilis TaxID=1808979 RepID=A0A5Q0BRT2_9GAMM|nr:(Fe-S)-binding protein [Candidatus Methylospira mobilis]QFY44777.1 (Fe-S)-binding protein [Candidatus Methylospira mobilis]WNV05682.1 (Fe-S)-binding protein [Candidatus Methylospira mobilis]